MRQVQCGLATIRRGAEGVTVSVGIIWCLRNTFVLWQLLFVRLYAGDYRQDLSLY